MTARIIKIIIDNEKIDDTDDQHNDSYQITW